MWVRCLISDKKGGRVRKCMRKPASAFDCLTDKRRERWGKTRTTQGQYANRSLSFSRPVKNRSITPTTATRKVHTHACCYSPRCPKASSPYLPPMVCSLFFFPSAAALDLFFLAPPCACCFSSPPPPRCCCPVDKGTAWLPLLLLSLRPCRLLVPWPKPKLCCLGQHPSYLLQEHQRSRPLHNGAPVCVVCYGWMHGGGLASASSASLM